MTQDTLLLNMDDLQAKKRALVAEYSTNNSNKYSMQLAYDKLDNEYKSLKGLLINNNRKNKLTLNN